MDSIFNHPKLIVTIPDEVKNALVKNASPYPLPSGKKFQYGTAGVGISVPIEDRWLIYMSAVSHEGVSTHSEVSSILDHVETKTNRISDKDWIGIMRLTMSYTRSAL